MLGDFSRVLMTDVYTVMETLAAKGEVVVAALGAG
jgi:mannose-1-phosphate guanylyltransferase